MWGTKSSWIIKNHGQSLFLFYHTSVRAFQYYAFANQVSRLHFAWRAWLISSLWKCSFCKKEFGERKICWTHHTQRWRSFYPLDKLQGYQKSFASVEWIVFLCRAFVLMASPVVSLTYTVGFSWRQEEETFCWSGNQQWQKLSSQIIIRFIYQSRRGGDHVSNPSTSPIISASCGTLQGIIITSPGNKSIVCSLFSPNQKRISLRSLALPVHVRDDATAL